MTPAFDALSALLGDRFTTAEAIRSEHAQSETHVEAGLPDAVAFPETTAEVSALLKIAHDHRLPVIGWGAGTS